MARSSLRDDNARMDYPSLDPCARLSITAALTTIPLKGFTLSIAGPVGRLADALESVVRERH